MELGMLRLSRSWNPVCLNQFARSAIIICAKAVLNFLDLFKNLKLDSKNYYYSNIVSVMRYLRNEAKYSFLQTKNNNELY